MPSNHGHQLAKVHKATPVLIQEAIRVSQEARREWARMPLEHRSMIFRKAADLFAGPHRARICATTMLGQGKTVWQAEIDAAVETADFLRLNTKFAQDIYDVQPPLHSPGVWNRLEYRELEGFILAVSPFNFTAIGANLCSAPALMGNTVLWKPSNTAALANYVSYQVFQEAGLPAGVISFLPADPQVAGSAITHRDLAGLHFTGSTKTFNTLWQQIGQNLPNYRTYPRIVGETGGKNFHLVHPSAHLANAVNQTIRGAFEFQGQKCSATSRLYVPKSLWDKAGGFKEQLLAGVASIKMGQPDDFKAYMSAVIDKPAFDKHAAYLQHAKQDVSCLVLAGGNCSEKVGYFVEPTVIVTTDPLCRTMKEEIFGPVLTVFVYDDRAPGYWDSLLKTLDATSPYALTGSIFAVDRNVLVQTADTLRHTCGNLYFNDKSTGAVVGEQPFGGARASGTNDKAGSHLNLLRWVSARTTKESTLPITGYAYPYMN